MTKDFTKELEQLSSKSMVVTFEKKDGTIRKMRCTSDLNRIPEENHPLGTGVKKTGIKPVFDLDKNEWRSFRLDSIISIEDE